MKTNSQITIEENTTQLVVADQSSKWARFGENCLILFGSIILAPMALIVAYVIISSPLFSIMFVAAVISDYCRAKTPTGWQKFMFYFVILACFALVLLVVLTGMVLLFGRH